jgi:hypothetical protein
VGALTQEPSTMGSMWLTNRPANSLFEMGVVNQMQAALGNIPISANDWANFSSQPDAGQTKEKSIDFFRVFHGFTPLTYTSSGGTIQNSLRGVSFHQAPFSPIRKIQLTTKLQANDPLVHYTLDDLVDRRQTNILQFVRPPQTPLNDSNLGRMNERHRPWGGRPGSTAQIEDFDYRFKDPLIRSSDNWQFSTNKMPNIGWLGRVHRGTPWQTIYFKGGVFDEQFNNSWFLWAGNFFTNPTNDWKIPSMFTVAPNANASRGLLSVNQSGAAAWSAILSGVEVLTNNLSDGVVSGLRDSAQASFTNITIRPTSSADSQVRSIVNSINSARTNFADGRFPNLGSVLASPGLTVDSPFINGNASQRSYALHDTVYERIPEKVLSLLKSDEPRFTIYAFGQTLDPAENSIYRTPNQFFQMATNYQISAEIATKTIMRFDGAVTNIQAVIEDFQLLPAEFFEP